MNLQEHIRKVLREERNLSLFIRRRVPHHELEKEFKESLDMASDMFFNEYKMNKNVMKLGRFTDITISITIDGIHYALFSTMPDGSEWYIDAHNALKEYYQDIIESRYKELQKLIPNIIE
jgi:hypothetical protein